MSLGGCFVFLQPVYFFLLVIFEIGPGGLFALPCTWNTNKDSALHSTSSLLFLLQPKKKKHEGAVRSSSKADGWRRAWLHAACVARSTLLHHSQVTQKILCVITITLPGAKRHCSRKEDSFSHSLLGSGSGIDIKLGWLKIEEEVCVYVWLLTPHHHHHHHPLPTHTHRVLLSFKWQTEARWTLCRAERQQGRAHFQNRACD